MAAETDAWSVPSLPEAALAARNDVRRSGRVRRLKPLWRWILFVVVGTTIGFQLAVADSVGTECRPEPAPNPFSRSYDCSQDPGILHSLLLVPTVAVVVVLGASIGGDLGRRWLRRTAINKGLRREHRALVRDGAVPSAAAESLELMRVPRMGAWDETLWAAAFYRSLCFLAFGSAFAVLTASIIMLRNYGGFAIGLLPNGMAMAILGQFAMTRARICAEADEAFRDDHERRVLEAEIQVMVPRDAPDVTPTGRRRRTAVVGGRLPGSVG